MTLAFAGDTHPGRARSNNEDVIGWDAARGLWLVADGMGGHASGEVASGIVRDTLLAQADDPASEEWISRAHRAVQDAARKDDALDGMGSTVVALKVSGRIGHVVWVGDSRAYLWRRDALRRLTRDHSFVEMLRERGDITESQVRNHPNRNIVTQTLGLGDPAPSVVDVGLKRGDRILLCSDGLNDELTDAEIAEIMREHAGLEEATRHLIERALDRGGRDNVSVVLVEYDGHNEGIWGRLHRALMGIVRGRPVTGRRDS